MQNDKAVIILNHGTRNKQAQESFNVFARTLREKFQAVIIEHASMELSEPSMPVIIKKLYESGKRDIVIVPFFLFSGMHIVKDIPEIIEEERQKYSDLKITFGKPIMPDNRLMDILYDRIKETLK